MSERRRSARVGLAIVSLAFAAVVVGAAQLGGLDGARGGQVDLDGPLPSCDPGDRATPHGAPEDWARTLLDPGFGLAEDAVPTDLEAVADHGIRGTGSVRAFVIDDLAAMSRAAHKADTGFRVKSAFRNYAQQTRTLASLEQAYGIDEARRSAARPGHSEHQLGTTIDVEGGETWLAVNAWRYGFVMSYPPDQPESVTCYKPEPWHFRYMGRDAARAIHESGRSLREWLWEHQAYA